MSEQQTMPAHLAAAHAAIRESQQQPTVPPMRRVHYARLDDPKVGLRVNKWDALILDAEITALLKTPMKSMFSMLEPGVMDRVKPEIDAMLGAMLFFFSTGIRRVRCACVACIEWLLDRC